VPINQFRQLGVMRKSRGQYGGGGGEMEGERLGKSSVFKFRKKLFLECHPVLVTGPNELPEGFFSESIGFAFTLPSSF
jgi:hypothetical protein